MCIYVRVLRMLDQLTTNIMASHPFHAREKYLSVVEFALSPWKAHEHSNSTGTRASFWPTTCVYHELLACHIVYTGEFVHGAHPVHFLPQPWHIFVQTLLSHR